ncbi:14294_t:CDS:2 [Rhizophagus irregularis]|nr:14294_t:CDS:2 [Rhizophagus irregularis]
MQHFPFAKFEFSETLATSSNYKKKNLRGRKAFNRIKNALWKSMGPSVGCVSKRNKLFSPKASKW